MRKIGKNGALTLCTLFHGRLLAVFSRRRRRSSLAARSFHPNGDTWEQEVSCVWDEQLHDLPLNLEAEHYAKIEKKKEKKTSWRLVDVLWGEKLMFVGIIVKSFLTFWLIKCLKSYKRDERREKKSSAILICVVYKAAPNKAYLYCARWWHEKVWQSSTGARTMRKSPNVTV